MAEPEAESSWQMEKIYAERVAFEHELISHRMSWLMTSNGFLVAGTALLLSNGDELTSSAALQALLLGIGAMGVVSNCSSLFSNYWASRGGIRGADQALEEYWRGLPDGEFDRRSHLMRFFGRDPRALGLRQRAAPPTEVLHPWFALPVTFAVVFALLPFFSPEFLPPGDRLPDVFRLLHLLPVAVGGVLIGLDRRFHARNRARASAGGTGGAAADPERNGTVTPAADDRPAGVRRPG